MELTLAQLATRLRGEICGGDADAFVHGAAGLDTVSDDQVTFIADQRRLPEAEDSPALAVIAPRATPPGTKPRILVDDPVAAFSQALRLFDWRRPPLPGIDPTAALAHSAAVHAHAHIGPHVTIGDVTYIATGCVVHANVVIGDHVEIGEGTVIYPNVTIYPRCVIGKRCIIHAGTVIGADGFGYLPGPTGAEKIPHLGTVIIEDDVEIGANTTIDRAKTGSTVIGHGTKIDNLVHIAHNVKIGPHTLIIAQVGIAGSTVLGSGVIFAGQAGAQDHLHIGDGVKVAARAGVTRDIPAGTTVSGFPAQPHPAQLRQEATVRRLPEALEAIRRLEQRVRALENSPEA